MCYWFQYEVLSHCCIYAQSLPVFLSTYWESHVSIRKYALIDITISYLYKNVNNYSVCFFNLDLYRYSNYKVPVVVYIWTWIKLRQSDFFLPNNHQTIVAKFKPGLGVLIIPKSAPIYNTDQNTKFWVKSLIPIPSHIRFQQREQSIIDDLYNLRSDTEKKVVRVKV